jgi:hypothetical protein
MIVPGLIHRSTTLFQQMISFIRTKQVTDTMASGFLYGSVFVVVAATIYFLIRTGTRYPLYFTVLVLYVIQSVGLVFKIMHLPGADELLMLGYAGTVGGSLLLIWKGFKNQAKEIYLYKILSGVIILAQFVLAYFWPHEIYGVARILHYPIVALLGTILLKDQWEHEGEKNLMMLFVLQSLIFILNDVMKSL